jgi:DNA-binding transcriptional ArsR family regulator
MSDGLREQIEALRSEVRQLSESFVGLRDDEVRRVFARQVRPVLAERIERDLGADEGSRTALLDWMNHVLDAFERGGQVEGQRYVDRRRARDAGDADDPGFAELADSLEEQTRAYLDTYGRVVRRPDGDRIPVRTVGELSPQRVEETLGPLNNAIRIGLLQHLAREDDGLAAMSRALGLQKGHLQFHLRCLLGGRYIEYDRRSRLYALSPRGRRALDGLGRLMADLDADR